MHSQRAGANEAGGDRGSIWRRRCRADGRQGSREFRDRLRLEGEWSWIVAPLCSNVERIPALPDVDCVACVPCEELRGGIGQKRERQGQVVGARVMGCDGSGIVCNTTWMLCEYGAVQQGQAQCAFGVLRASLRCLGSKPVILLFLSSVQMYKYHSICVDWISSTIHGKLDSVVVLPGTSTGKGRQSCRRFSERVGSQLLAHREVWFS